MWFAYQMWCSQCCHPLVHQCFVAPVGVLYERRGPVGQCAKLVYLLAVLAGTLFPELCHPHHGRLCWKLLLLDQIWPQHIKSPHHDNEWQPACGLPLLQDKHKNLNDGNIIIKYTAMSHTSFLEFKVLLKNWSKAIALQKSNLLDHFFPIVWDVF